MQPSPSKQYSRFSTNICSGPEQIIRFLRFMIRIGKSPCNWKKCTSQSLKRKVHLNWCTKPISKRSQKKKDDMIRSLAGKKTHKSQIPYFSGIKTTESVKMKMFPVQMYPITKLWVYKAYLTNTDASQRNTHKLLGTRESVRPDILEASTRSSPACSSQPSRTPTPHNLWVLSL